MTLILSPYVPTWGRVLAFSDVTVVSWPAKEGAEAWYDLVGVRGLISYTCVWTGVENCSVQSWFLPWQNNMLHAMELGLVHTMRFILPNDLQLGAGQSLEWEWVRRNRLDERIRVLPLAEVLEDVTQRTNPL